MRGRQGYKIVGCMWGCSVGAHHLFECTPPLTSPFPKVRCHISSSIKTLNYVLLSREGGLVVGGTERRGGEERSSCFAFQNGGSVFG